MRTKFLVVFALASLTSYGQYTLNDFKALYSLASTWEIKSYNGILMEQWQRIHDSVMHSRSYRVQGKDTILQETAELKYAGGRISFTPTVPDQNQGLPVSFQLISIEGTTFTFENKTHDFPQQIIYTIGEKKLNVTIRGNTRNGYKEIPFDFTLK